MCDCEETRPTSFHAVQIARFLSLRWWTGRVGDRQGLFVSSAVVPCRTRFAFMHSARSELTVPAAPRFPPPSPPPSFLQIILLGDSAVGKSKLIERYLLDDYHPRQRSTFALTLYRHDVDMAGKKVAIDFWDTAGTSSRTRARGERGCIRVSQVSGL
jgi:hypothetical protein